MTKYSYKFLFVFLISISVFAQPTILKNIRPLSPSEQYVVTSWNSNSGLPQNSINRIVEDKNGFIWLATYGGLVRFDGYRFKVYTASEFPVLQNDRINGLFLDSKNRLWISNEIGKLILFDGKIFTDITSKFPTNYLNIYQFAEDSRGNIYLSSTTKELFYYSKDSVTKLVFPRIKKPSDEISFISFSYQTNNDSLLVIYNNRTALFYNGRAVKTGSISKPVEFHNQCIYDAGGIWLLYGSKLYYAKNIEAFSNPTHLFPHKSFSTIYKKDSAILAGTDDGAIVLIKNNSLETIISRGNISTTLYSRVYIDSENNFWIGTQLYGLYLIKKRFLYNLDKTFGINELNTYPILNSTDSSIWIGQNPGIQKLIGNKKIITPFAKELITWAITEDKNKNIWIGANGNGIWKVENNSLVDYSDKDSLRQRAGVSYFSAFTDKSGKIWFGSIGAVTAYVNGKFNVFHPDKERKNLYRHFIEDDNGTIWVASDDGLYKNENGQFSFVKEANAKSARSLYIDKKKRLWVGTYGNGLRIKLKDKFVTITKKNGLFNDIISAIVEDGKGNFWFTCNNGIFRIRETEIENYLEGKKDFLISIHYGSEEGLANIEFNGGCQPSWMRDSEDNLWFPSFGGPVIVDIKSFRDLVKEPRVFIESITAGEKIFYAGDNIVLPGNYTNFTISFNSPSFASPQNVRFKYQLIGVDSAWHDYQGKREITYQKLPYGNYEFKILASDSYGNWSVHPASIKFTVDSIFWETPFFYLIISITLIGGVFLFFIYRLKFAKSQQLKLEKIIEERTQNYRIAKEEAEKAVMEEKKLRDKAEEENRQKIEILRIVSHDLKNPVFAIKGFAEILLEENNLVDDDKRLVEMIGEAGERMQDLITQLLNFSRFEGQSFSIEKNIISAITEIEKVLQHLSPAAAKKYQTIKKDYDIKDARIFADTILFTQIIENLISNAIKYSSKGKEIIIGVSDSDKNLKITIKDYGQGFSLEDQNNLYKPFVKLSAVPTAGEASSGLGLAIVKKFVELNEGTINLESQKGVGSTFTLEFQKVK